MKIAISGSGGTGKSTLAAELSRLMGIHRVDEGVRDFLTKHNIKHLRELSPEDTMVMQDEIFMTKYVQETFHKEFIADRCTADNAAYALRWCARDVPSKMMLDYILKCKQHAKATYDVILFLPWNSIPLEDDGVRSAQLMYQYEISCLIKGLLIDWDLSYHNILSQSLDDRVDETLNIIYKIGGLK